MSVHYKFKSSNSYDTIAFDGLHISVRDLKKAILHQKQIGKSTDFDLQISNAQSNEVYVDEGALIPKNSSLIVVRVPLTPQQKKAWEKSDAAQLHLIGLGKGNSDPSDILNKFAKSADLTSIDASEEDKIQAAIAQSTFDYDPSNYVRIKGSNQVGEIPANYRCYKCLQPGHWIKDCKLNAQQDVSVEIRKSTGIPRSFMVPVEGPEVPGAMMTPSGQFAIPAIDRDARNEPPKKVTDTRALEKPPIPDDLVCGVCKDLLSDAVLIHCCGNSFCDECIRNVLLDSEDHQCPICKQKDVSPDTLIPNRFLRKSVSNFKNQTGYIREAKPKEVVVATSEKKPESEPHPDPTPEPVIPAKVDKKTSEPAEEPQPLELIELNDEGDEDVTEVAISSHSSSPPTGNAIPSLSMPIRSLSYQYPHHRPTNPNTFLTQGDDSTLHHHHQRNNPRDSYRSRGRGDRSGTPTIDERVGQHYRGSYPPVHGIRATQPPPHHLHYPQPNPPVSYSGSVEPRPLVPHPFHHQQPPPRLHIAQNGRYVFEPYNSGIQGYGMDYGNKTQLPSYRNVPQQPPPPAASSPSNGGHISGPIDPVEEMVKDIIEKKRNRRGRKQRSRSYSRSYSRSSSPPRYSRTRSRSRQRSIPRSPKGRSPIKGRSPRKRSSRHRSRSPRHLRSYRSRSRSRSKSPHYTKRRSRSKSHSFSISRSRSSSIGSNPRRSPRRRVKNAPPHSTGSPLLRSHSPRSSSHRYKSSKADSRSSYKGSSVATSSSHSSRNMKEFSSKDYARYERGDRQSSRYGREKVYSTKGLFDESSLSSVDKWDTVVEKAFEYLGEKEKQRKKHVEDTDLLFPNSVDYRDRESGRTWEKEKNDGVTFDPGELKTNASPIRIKSSDKEHKVKESRKKSETSDKKEIKKVSAELKEKKEEVFSTATALTTNVVEKEKNQSEEKLADQDDLYKDLDAKVDLTALENMGKVGTDASGKSTTAEADSTLKDVMLAPVPELSKWEKEDDLYPVLSDHRHQDISREPKGENGKQVTSDVLKRAENALFKKSVNPIKQTDKKERREPDKRRESDRKDKSSYRESDSKDSKTMKSIALPMRIDDSKSRKSVRPSAEEKDKPRISAKKRLGAKIDDVIINREFRIDKRNVQIEKPLKSAPKELDARIIHKDHKDHHGERKVVSVKKKDDDIVIMDHTQENKHSVNENKIHSFASNFESGDGDVKLECKKKLSPGGIKRSGSFEGPSDPVKRIKVGPEAELLDSSNMSSDDSLNQLKKSKKKKRKKSKKKKSKKKRKHDSSTESESTTGTSTSESDDEKKRKKLKYKHKSHKKSKKRKKSKK